MRQRGSGIGANTSAMTSIASMPARPPSTSAPPSKPNATANTTEAIERTPLWTRPSIEVRRKSRLRRSCASGTATIAPIRNHGVVSATSCAVPVPKIGCTTRG